MKTYLPIILGCFLIFSGTKAFAQAYSYPTVSEPWSGTFTPALPTASGPLSSHVATTSGSGEWTVDGAYGSTANGNPTNCIRLNKSSANGTGNQNGSLITPLLNTGATTLTFDIRSAATGGATTKSFAVFKIIGGIEDPTPIYTSSIAASTAAAPVTWTTIVVGVNINNADLKLKIKNMSPNLGTGNNDLLLDNVIATAYAAVPFISTIGTLSTFNQIGLSTPTAGQSYFISGSNLTNNVDITAPTGFQLSTDSSAWSGTLSLSQTAGSIAGQPLKIFVRANSALSGTVGGNIVHQTTGGMNANVSVLANVTPAYYLKSGLPTPVDASNLSNYTTSSSGGVGITPTNFTDDAVFVIKNTTQANLASNVVMGTKVKFIVGDGVDTTSFEVGTGVKLTGIMDVSIKALATINGTFENSSNTGVSTSSGTVSGTLIVNGSHNLTGNGAVVFSLVGTPVITYSTSSTINVTGATTILGVFQNYSIANTSAPTILNVPVGNVVWNCTSQTTAASFVSGTGNATLFVQGNFTVQSTGSSHLLIGNGIGGRTINVGGNLIINAGEFRVAGFNATASSNSANANCFVTGNVEVANGATLIVSASSGIAKGYLYVKGNIVNNGTISNTSTNTTFTNGNRGIIVLSGTANQSITSASNFATGGNGRVILHLNTDGVVTLNSPITIDSLFITKGKIALGTNDLTLGMENAVLDTAATVGYVITNGTGGLVMPVATQTSFLLPVGNSTDAKPATITFAAAPSTPGTLKARFDNAYSGETLSPALTQAGITPEIDRVEPGQWQIDNTGIVFTTYAISAVNNGATSIVDGQLANTVLVVRPNGGSWALQGTHVTTTGSNASPILSRTGLTSFSQFALAGKFNTVLPIVISKFSGENRNNANSLAWSLNTKNQIKIELQKSGNGIDFETIYVTQTIFNSNVSNQSFSYTDQSLVAKSNFYRLKITNEIANSIVYSTTIVLKATKTPQLELLGAYPNPVKQFVNVQISAQEPSNIQLILTDITGKVISTQKATITSGVTALPILTSNLSSGAYQLSVINNGERIGTIKLVK